MDMFLKFDVEVESREPIRPLPTVPSMLLGLGMLIMQSAQAAPEIQRWRTPSGAKVLFVSAPELPIIDVRVVFDAGSARDGERPGLASLTAAMLSEGAADLDADAIAERVEAVGAELGAGVDRDTSFARLRSLTEPEALETALDTLIKVLAEPRFDASEFERVQQNRLTGLRLAEQDPGSVGQKALYRAVFGDHPYASDPSGTAASVAALTVDDLRAFHQRHYGAAVRPSPSLGRSIAPVPRRSPRASPRRCRGQRRRRRCRPCRRSSRLRCNRSRSPPARLTST